MVLLFLLNATASSTKLLSLYRSFPFPGQNTRVKPTPDSRSSSVLLSTACPTSLASDQTKGGGRPGVQRTPRFGAREQRFNLTKIQLSSKLSPKDPKEFAKKIREWRGAAPGEGRATHHNTKGKSTETSRLYIYHTEKRSGRATPEIFLRVLLEYR